MSVRPLVVKIGGSTLGSHDTTLQDLVTLQKEGTIPVVIHGGGKVITQWMERQGLWPRFVQGLRVTDEASMDVVAAVLCGLINKQLVGSLTALGGKCIGMSGVDGLMLQAKIANPDLGLVGEVTEVNVEPIMAAVASGYIPMIAPVGIHEFDGGPNAGRLLNINGDTAAGQVARALRASRLVFLSDVAGVLDTGGRLIESMDQRTARLLLGSGVASGGMIPKLEAAMCALEVVAECDVTDGRKPGALVSCARGNPTGTRIRNRAAEAPAP